MVLKYIAVDTMCWALGTWRGRRSSKHSSRDLFIVIFVSYCLLKCNRWAEASPAESSESCKFFLMTIKPCIQPNNLNLHPPVIVT